MFIYEILSHLKFWDYKIKGWYRIYILQMFHHKDVFITFYQLMFYFFLASELYFKSMSIFLHSYLLKACTYIIQNIWLPWDR